MTCGRRETEEAIDIVDKWCTLNGMEINKKKTKILIIHKRKGSKNNINKEVRGIEIVDSYKYLGIELDSTLSLHGYIRQLEKKVQSFKLHIPKLLINTVSIKTR